MSLEKRKTVTITIDRCDNCPYFDNEYYDYAEYCTLLGVKIKHKNGVFEIPEICNVEKVNNGFII